MDTTIDTITKYENILQPSSRNRVKTVFALDDLDRLIEDIMGLPKIQENRSYVYFLIKDEIIVYVGKTNSPARRVQEHRAEGKIHFDCAKVATMDNDEQMEAAEAVLIQRLQPKYNILHREGGRSGGGSK